MTPQNTQQPATPLTPIDPLRHEALGLKVSRSELALFGDLARVVRYLGIATEATQKAVIVLEVLREEAQSAVQLAEPKLDHEDEDTPDKALLNMIEGALNIAAAAHELVAGSHYDMAQLGMLTVKFEREQLARYHTPQQSEGTANPTQGLTSIQVMKEAARRAGVDLS